MSRLLRVLLVVVLLAAVVVLLFTVVFPRVERFLEQDPTLGTATAGHTAVQVLRSAS